MQAEQAPEIPFEDIEEMVDEALALSPPGEFKIPVSCLCTEVTGAQEVKEIFCRRASQPDGWMLWK